MPQMPRPARLQVGALVLSITSIQLVYLIKQKVNDVYIMYTLLVGPREPVVPDIDEAEEVGKVLRLFLMRGNGQQLRYTAKYRFRSINAIS